VGVNSTKLNDKETLAFDFGTFLRGIVQIKIAFMKNTYTIILVVILSFLFTNCAKTVDPVWGKLDETHCRPSWVGNSDYQIRKNLEALLRGDGVIPLKIRIKGNRNNNCESCLCFTGETYRISIDRSQLNWLIYYGFEVE